MEHKSPEVSVLKNEDYNETTISHDLNSILLLMQSVFVLALS